jgi:hypothetical protein
MIDFILRLCRQAHDARPERMPVQRTPLDVIDLTAQDEQTERRVREAILLARPWAYLWNRDKRRTIGEA